jgi:hypothetical protein
VTDSDAGRGLQVMNPMSHLRHIHFHAFFSSSRPGLQEIRQVFRSSLHKPLDGPDILSQMTAKE